MIWTNKHIFPAGSKISFLDKNIILERDIVFSVAIQKNGEISYPMDISIDNINVRYYVIKYQKDILYCSRIDML